MITTRTWIRGIFATAKHYDYAGFYYVGWGRTEASAERSLRKYLVDPLA